MCLRGVHAKFDEELGTVVPALTDPLECHVGKLFVGTSGAGSVGKGECERAQYEVLLTFQLPALDDGSHVTHVELGLDVSKVVRH